MPKFPSVAWFEALRDAALSDPDWKHFGQMDCAMGVQVGDEAYKLVFEGYEVTEVSEITGRVDQEDLDFTLVQSPQDWRDMLENIRANGHADRTHTLNTLDLENPEEFAKGDDYTRRDLFYRFNQTLQDFFDAAAHVETSYA